MVSLRSADFI